MFYIIVEGLYTERAYFRAHLADLKNLIRMCQKDGTTIKRAGYIAWEVWVKQESDEWRRSGR